MTSSRNQSIDEIADTAVFDIQFSEFQSSVTFSVRRRRGEGNKRGRTKLVRRTRNGSSPYFCDSSGAPFGVADRIIDRWMDGVGKGEKGSSSARVPSRLAIPLSIFLPPRVPSSSPLAVPFPILSLSVSRWSLPCSLPLSRFRYLPLGFRYLIKSSYDEKDEDPTKRAGGSVVAPPFLFTSHRLCSREKNWGMIMRGRWKPRWEGVRFSRELKLLRSSTIVGCIHGLLANFEECQLTQSEKTGNDALSNKVTAHKYQNIYSFGQNIQHPHKLM